MQFVAAPTLHSLGYYYGKTKHHFYIRAAEHMEISVLTSTRVKNVNQSAVSDHLLTCCCNINSDDFTISSKDSSNFNLLINENIFTACDNSFLNKTVTSLWFELFE